MAYKRKNGGVWTDLAAVKRKTGGAWVTCSNIYRKTGGVWVKIWPVGPPVNIIGGYISSSGPTIGSTISRYQLGWDGIEYSKSGTGAYTGFNTWLLSGTNNLYDARLTVTADNGLGLWGGSPAGSWVNLAGGAEWTYGDPGIGDNGIASGLIEVRLASTGVVQDSATVTFDTTRF